MVAHYAYTLASFRRVGMRQACNPVGATPDPVIKPSPGDQVLEEEIDENYEPTEAEIVEYATWLGMVRASPAPRPRPIAGA